MPLIILDRDGVINHDSIDYIKSPDEWSAIDGSLESISRLTQSGYRVVVASNQSGFARKKFKIADLNAVHQHMLDQVAQFGGVIEAVFFCPHASRQGCECRKPKPGMLLDISERLGIPLSDVFFVGDSQRDIDAANNAGAKPVLVRTGNGEILVSSGSVPDDVPIYADLASFVECLLSRAA